MQPEVALLRGAALTTLALLAALGHASARRSAEPRPSASTIRRASSQGLSLPLVRQETGYSCGAASLSSVLRLFTEWRGDERRLHRELGTNSATGTEPERLVAAARRRGLQAELRTGLTVRELRSAVKRGQAVILELQAWPETPGGPLEQRWDAGHYVVLKSVGTRYLYLMDPWWGEGSGARRPRVTYLPIEELLGRWHAINARDTGGRRDRQLGVVIEAPGETPRPRVGRASQGSVGLVRME